jgi:hypothetical protein
MSIVEGASASVNGYGSVLPEQVSQPGLPLGLEPGRAASAARSLVTLLGGSVWGAIQGPDGGYAGRKKLSVGDLEAHFNGEISVAIRCADGDNARVLAWDLDERASDRMRALSRVLERHGLAGSAIGTEGSDAGRGKVILFVRPTNQTAAVTLVEAILDQARQEPEWGIERPGTVEARPRVREGGLLRIGGRNVRRHGALERIFDLTTGEAITLSRVRITDLDLPAVPQPVMLPRIPPYLEKMLTDGLPWPQAGTAGVRRVLARIAAHAIRTGRGRAAYDAWVTTIRSKSPWLDEPSPKNGDKRGALRPELTAAIFENSVARITPTETVAWDTTSSGLRRRDVVSQRGRLPGALGVVESAIREVVRARDLHPAAFEVSYRELAGWTGLPRMAVFRAVKSLAESGHVLIVDRGTQGSKGDKTIYALPEASSATAGRPVTRNRKRKRAQYEAALAERVVTLDDRRPKDAPAGTDALAPSPPPISSSVSAMPTHMAGERRSAQRSGRMTADRATARSAEPAVMFDFSGIYEQAAEQRRLRERTKRRRLET